ncbi:MAG: right-handed parallel beta-helix repeat-containing protein, partial [bacterium]
MSKKLMRGVVLSMGVFLVEYSGATTTVSGNQSGIWNLVGSPYVVTGTVTVPEGLSLTINPGVVVKFATNTSLLNYGTLTAIGTPDGTITFTSNSPTPQAGDWNSIKFSSAQSKGTISYCLIEYGKQAVYLENTSKITITHNIIRNNKGNSGVGPYSRGEIGAGIYLSSSTDTIITGNTICDNQGGQGGRGDTYSSGGSGGIGAGIYLGSSTNNTITSNTIYNNQGGYGGEGGWEDNYSSGGQGGIGAGIHLLSSTNNTILSNIIINSQRGEGGSGGNFGGSTGMPGNGYGIYINSNSYNNIIDSNNTYNSEPIHYYYGITTPTIIENQTLTPIGSGSTNLGRVVLINCQNFIIRNNSIAGGVGKNGYTGGEGESGGIGAGIYVDSSSNINIINNIIYKNQGGQGGTGGYGNSGGYGGIGAGIYLSSSTNNAITGNTFYENKGGSGGTSGGYGGLGRTGGIGTGIYLNLSRNNTITGNTGYENKGGSGGNRGSYDAGGSGGIGSGIYLYSSINNVIRDNSISNNYYGEGGPSGNCGNGYGIYIDSNSYNNIIDSNNTYNSEPIHYYYGITTPTIIENQTLTPIGSGSTNLGRVVLINCQNFIIRNNSLAGGVGKNGYTGGEGESGGIGAGIYLGLSTNNTITGNTFYENKGGSGGAGGWYGSGGIGGIGAGIYLGLSTNNTITGNTFYENKGGSGGTGGGYKSSGGIGGIGAGIYLSSSTNNTITGNTIYENKSESGGGGYYGSGGGGGIGAGIYLGSSTNNTITGNTIYENKGGFGGGGDYSSEGGGGIGTGIYLGSSTNNTITGNTVYENKGGSGNPNGNGIGIYCRSSVISNLIYNNIYNNQTYNLQTDISPSTQSAEYNWWGADPPNISKFSGNIDYTPWLTGSYPPPPPLIINPILGTIGTIVTVSDGGFGASELIKIDFGTTLTITMVTSLTSGSFSATFTVDTQPYGFTSLRATGLSSSKTAEAAFCILPALVQVTPAIGTVGTVVMVRGNGFGARELVAIRFGTTPTIQTASTYAEGSFITTFSVNTQPYGTITISASGVASGVAAYNTFFIQPNIIRLTPAYGTVGSFVTISGNGFGAIEGIQIDFGTTLHITQISSTSYGSFATTFTIDTQFAGAKTISAMGMRSGERAFATYTILSNIIFITPSRGTVGTPVRIVGNGYGASEVIAISFGTTRTISLAVDDYAGKFDTTFTINTQPYGTT